ncbi:MAG TPA: hypothetical protein VN181_06885 [Thermoanaerobaculia bacterium]|nr:hypothetical protein [Thermoanaerobaculia bacterium]
MIWREKRVLLVILALLLAANTAFFFTYRVRYKNRIDSLDQRLAESEGKLNEARAERLAAERRYASYRKVERDVQFIYDQKWATQSERLTAVIAEIKKLAVASDLVPRSYTFTNEEAKVVETARSGRRPPSLDATEVGISYGVEGTYEQVRRLINLLELSDQFVIIDAIALSSQSGETLQVNLHVKTLFRGDRPAGEVPASKRL